MRKQGKQAGLYTLDLRKNLMGDIYENRRLKPRGAVLQWIEGIGDPYDKAKNKFTIDWLCRAIDSAHTRPGIKNAAKELLSVENFTSNLSEMELFIPLNDHCIKSLGVIGKKLNDYYIEEELEIKLGKKAVEDKIGQCDTDKKGTHNFGLKFRRQDDPNVGLFPPAHELCTLCGDHESCPGHGEDFPYFTDESIYIHILRLVADTIDKKYQVIAKDACLKNNGEFSCGGIKGDSRIRSKALNTLDHGNEIRPRPALNIDCNRNCAVFQNADDLLSYARALKDESSLSIVRIKNGFIAKSEDKAKEFHLRVFMMNLLYDTGFTYGEMAERNTEKWDKYIESPPENPSSSWYT